MKLLSSNYMSSGLQDYTYRFFQIPCHQDILAIPLIVLTTKSIAVFHRHCQHSKVFAS